MRNADGEDRRQADDKWVIKPKCGLKACVHPNCLESADRKQEQRLRGLKAGQAASKAGRTGAHTKDMQCYSRPSVLCLLCEERIWDTKHFRTKHRKECPALKANGPREVKVPWERSNYAQVTYLRCTNCGEFVVNKPDDDQAHRRSCQPGTA